MSRALTVLSVFPDESNVNGDAENALVLAQRARWAGLTASVLRLGVADPTPTSAPSAIVFGSATDVAIPRLLSALAPHREAFADWLAAGIPLLAIGTGWEVLGESIALESGVVDGLALLPGRSTAASARVSDDLVVDTARFGRLVGYENHARGFAGDPGAALGTVAYGRGNAADSNEGAKVEGYLAGGVIGTHLHGPVLAKNPAVADYLLTLALGEDYATGSADAIRVDAIAKAARNIIAARLGLEAE